MLGYFKADFASTITTYTIVGSITKNNEVLEGDYSVAEKTNLTLSDRIIPETETPEESEENTDSEAK